MDRKIFRLAIFLLAAHIIFSGVEQIVAMALPAETGGWYYHDITGSDFGHVKVDSAYADLKGNPWNEQ